VLLFELTNWLIFWYTTKLHYFTLYEEKFARKVEMVCSLRRYMFLP